MDPKDVFSLGLGLNEPWKLAGHRLDVEKRPHELHLEVVADWLAAHVKAYGPDAKVQDDGAPADVVSTRKRIAAYLDVLRQGYATKEGAAADRLFDLAAKLEKQICFAPVSSPRAMALKLRVALRDTLEACHPVTAALALKQVIPVLEGMKPDDGLECAIREIASLRREVADLRRLLGMMMQRPARAKRSASSAGRV